jgi:ribosomal protein S18 acetylase RimI-like enzyme
MRVEPATTADVDALVDAWVALAEAQRRHGSHIAGADNREAIRPLLAYHAVEGTALVARGGPSSADPSRADGDSGPDDRPDDAIVGFVNFGLEEAGLESDAVRGIVHNVYVDPASRDEGVGSALLDAAEAELAERGADVVAIEALADNEAARRFYRERGYDPHRVTLAKPLGSDTPTR